MFEADLDNRFTYHAPDDNKKIMHEGIRAECKSMAEFFKEGLPSCRETSLAITKIEEAMFWANAALARN